MDYEQLRDTQTRLIERIQNGETSLLPKLWQTVERFAYKYANHYFNAMQIPGIDRFELVSCAYIAMCKAVETYNPQLGKSFPGWLLFYCRREWRNLYGLDSHDPQLTALRLDAPVGDTDADITLGDTICDVTAPTPEDSAEEADARLWLKSAMGELVSDLPDELGAIIEREYMGGKPLAQIAKELNITLATVYKHKKNAMARLKRATRHTPIGRQIRAYYKENIRNIHVHRVGLREFQSTHTSEQEKYLLRLERAEKSALAKMVFSDLSPAETVALSAIKNDNYHILSNYVQTHT